IAADAQRATSDSIKRKLKPDVDSYVFETYLYLYARNVSPRYSPNFPQAIDASWRDVKHSNLNFITEACASGRAVAATTAVSVKGALSALSSFGRDHCRNTSGSWIAGAVALPAAGDRKVTLEKEVAANICGAMVFGCSVSAAITVFLMGLILIAAGHPMVVKLQS
nr:hypothetical protein [Tanacetum cinerariifolium]